ncbi:hypothetical protein ACFX12_023657 [Malus domestica]
MIWSSICHLSRIIGYVGIGSRIEKPILDGGSTGSISLKLWCWNAPFIGHVKTVVAVNCGMAIASTNLALKPAIRKGGLRGSRTKEAIRINLHFLQVSTPLHVSNPCSSNYLSHVLLSHVLLT